MSKENRINLIGYFIKWYGNSNKLSNSTQFNYFNNDYDVFLSKKILFSNYGDNLELILIQYHISIPNNLLDFDYALKLPPLKNYSSKEKAISVIIPVIFDEFFNLSPQQKKQKFADDALYAVKLVKERLEKKRFNIDFDKLIADLIECNNEYLSY